MMHFVSASFVRDWPSRCPCGAAAAERYGLCVKCQARAAWKRRKTPARHKARRTARRMGRRAARLLPVPCVPRPASTAPANGRAPARS